MNILLTAPYNKIAIEDLQQIMDAKVHYHSWKPHGRAFNPDEIIQLLKDTKADAYIAEHDVVSKEVIAAFPHLEFIGICRGTPSNVDLEAASARHVPVFHTPARNAQAVAEMFIANVITLMRNTLPAIDWLESESWKEGAHDSYLQFKGNELAGKTIGIVGFGAIGQLIAKLVENFPCKILFYDPFVEDTFEYATSVSLEDIFAKSDIVSIHLPANKKTEGMINGELIGKMHEEAIFVNTSRAMVVDRQSLLKALEEKKIRGAVLDVFNNEPPDEIDYKLIHLPQVLATPHIAGATHEVEDHHAKIMNDNLKNWFVLHQGGKSSVANRKAILDPA